MRFRESFLPQHREKTYGRYSKARYSRQTPFYGSHGFVAYGNSNPRQDMENSANATIKTSNTVTGQQK